MLVLLASWIPCIEAQTELIKFENYSKDHGILHSQILDICQDKKGMLWIASYGGLNGFDGSTFTSYSADNSDIPTNIIYCVAEPKRGNENVLWLGSNLGLVKFNKETNSFQLFEQPNTGIFSIAEDENGKMWLATLDQGLLMFDPESGIFTQSDLGRSYITKHPEHTVNCCLYEQPDVLWLGTDGGDIIKYNCSYDSFEALSQVSRQKNVISPNGISCLYNLGSEILIGTIGGGLFIFDKLDESMKGLSLFLDGSEEIHQSITQITGDNSGNIWVSSFGGGLYEIEGFNTIRRGSPNYVIRNFRVGDDTPDPICSNLINVLYKDATGNIWIGSEGGGLSKLDFFKHRISHYGIESPNGRRVGDNNISAIYEDVKGNIWFGIRNNGLYIYNPGRDEYKHVLLHPEDVNDRRNAVHDIYGDKYNRIWVSTDLGVYMFTTNLNPDSYFSLTRPDANSLNRNAFITMCLDNRDALWISDGDHGIYKMEAEDIENSNPEMELSLVYTNIPGDSTADASVRIWGIMCDSNGSIWVPTSKGLYKYNEKEDSFDQLFIKHVNTAYEPESGLGDYLWLASYGDGIFLLNLTDLSSINFNEAMGLCHNNVNGIVEDELGNIWVSTAKGIASIYTKGLYGSNLVDFESESNLSRIRNYRKSDGLQAHEFNISAAERLSDNRLIFGGPNGYNLFDPLTIEENKYVFPVTITDFKVYNKSILNDTSFNRGQLEYLRKVRLKHNENFFTIDFNAICFTSPEEVVYQYMLEGLDNEWISSKAGHNQATFNKMEAGDYIFKVKASNADGYWSDQTTVLNINIAPPVWQTLPFRIACIILLSVITFLFVRYQRKAFLRKRSRTLQSQKEMYEREKMLSDLENKNRELATTTMYIVKKNEKLIEVRNMMIELKEHISPDNKSRFTDILESIDDDLKNQDNWESFELNFNLIHNNFIARLIEEYPSLSHNDVKICAYMRMNLSSKEIANLLNITPKSLETNRVRMRKRMKLNSSVYLSNYIMRF